MTVTTWTLTGDVSDLAGDDWPTTGATRAEAYLTAYDGDGPCKFYADPATGGKVRFGPTIPITLASDGTFTRAGIPDSSETGLSYALTLTYRPTGHGRSVATTTDRFTLDADKALNQVGFVNPDFSAEVILAQAVDAVVAPLITGGALTNPAVDTVADERVALHTGDTSDAHDASAISYSAASSGLAATTAQGAIDEVAAASMRTPLYSFAQKLRAGEDLRVGFATDSTGDETGEWPRRMMDTLLAARPWYTHDYQVWDGTSAMTATTLQTGAAATVTAVALDNFTRTAADLTGSTPPRGGTAWSGASGCFSLDGSAAVWAASNGYVVSRTNFTPGGNFTVRGTITVDMTAGAASKTLNVGSYKYGTNAERISIWAKITSGGTISWGVEGQFTGFATIVTGGGTPLVPGVQTVAFSLTVAGTAVTAVLNGVTATATLSAPQAASVAGHDSLYILPTGTLTGWKILNIQMEVASTHRPVATCTTYNGAMSGSTLAYQQARLATMYPSTLDVLLVASSHNYALTTAVDYLTAVGDFITAFRAVQPTAAIVLLSENPEVAPRSQANIAAHRARCVALKPYALANGFGYVPVFEAFDAVANWPTLIRADGIHPTTAGTYDDASDPDNGQYVWATAVGTWLAALAA